MSGLPRSQGSFLPDAASFTFDIAIVEEVMTKVICSVQIVLLICNAASVSLLMYFHRVIAS